MLPRRLLIILAMLGAFIPRMRTELRETDSFPVHFRLMIQP